jgi:hypothetical protein
MTLIEEIRQLLSTLSPHAAQWRTAVLLRAAIAELQKAQHDIRRQQAIIDARTAASAGCFLAYDNSDPPQLWVWRGEPGDESSEPWQPVKGLDVTSSDR